MKITIITAVLNREDTILDAIKSVETQNYPQLEHVIQDGGSTDQTLNLIRQFKNASRILITEHDCGIYDAINKGISRSSGDIVGLMHSDDFFATDNVLEKIAHAFTDPNIDGVYGDLDYVSKSDPQRVLRRWRSGEFDLKKLKKGWMPPHPTLYLRREVYDRYGMYDTNLLISSDYEAMLRFLVQGKIRLHYIPEVLVKMRVGGASNQSFSQIMRKMQEDWIAIKRYRVGGFSTLMFKNLRKLSQLNVFQQ